MGDFAVFYEEFHSYRVTTERPVINAKLLRLARQDAGFTQAQAAEMVGVNRNTIVRYENGTSRPSPKTLRKLSEIYSKPPGSFFGAGSASSWTAEGDHAGQHDTATPAGRAWVALEMAISEAPEEVIDGIARRIREARLLHNVAKRGPADRSPRGERP